MPPKSHHHSLVTLEPHWTQSSQPSHTIQFHLSCIKAYILWNISLIKLIHFVHNRMQCFSCKRIPSLFNLLLSHEQIECIKHAKWVTPWSMIIPQSSHKIQSTTSPNNSHPVHQNMSQKVAIRFGLAQSLFHGNSLYIASKPLTTLNYYKPTLNHPTFQIHILRSTNYHT